jgi:hypothetical protein
VLRHPARGWSFRRFERAGRRGKRRGVRIAARPLATSGSAASLDSVMEGDGATWVDVAQAVSAVAGILIAALVAVMPFVRRPRLWIGEDSGRVHSRVEDTPIGSLPHVRLLVSNARWRRAAQGTRVLIEWYQPRNGERVSLSHPSLGWPSAPEAEATAAAVVFAGGHRPISLGRLIRVATDDEGRIWRPESYSTTFRQSSTLTRQFPHIEHGSGLIATGWFLYLGELDINDDRDKLEPVEGGYTIRLLVGADDGAARSFEVDISWEADPKQTSEEVLASALEHLAVRKV